MERESRIWGASCDGRRTGITGPAGCMQVVGAVFGVAGLVMAWAFLEHPFVAVAVLLVGVFMAVVCWCFSVALHALAAIERNTRKDSGEDEVPGPTRSEDSEGP